MLGQRLRHDMQRSIENAPFTVTAEVVDEPQSINNTDLYEVDLIVMGAGYGGFIRFKAQYVPQAMGIANKPLRKGDRVLVTFDDTAWNYPRITNILSQEIAIRNAQNRHRTTSSVPGEVSEARQSQGG